MSFQSTVRADQSIGIVGEIILDGPTRSEPAQIDPAATAANVVVGRMFSQDAATGLVKPGSGGAAIVQGTNKLIGILALPKNYALLGTSAGGSLASTLVVPVGTIAEFVSMTAGILLSSAGGVSGPGVQLQYHLTTGVISVPATLGTADANNALIPGTFVTRTANAAAGLVIAELNGLR